MGKNEANRRRVNGILCQYVNIEAAYTRDKHMHRFGFPSDIDAIGVRTMTGKEAGVRKTTVLARNCDRSRRTSPATSSWYTWYGMTIFDPGSWAMSSTGCEVEVRLREAETAARRATREPGAPQRGIRCSGTKASEANRQSVPYDLRGSIGYANCCVTACTLSLGGTLDLKLSDSRLRGCPASVKC